MCTKLKRFKILLDLKFLNDQFNFILPQEAEPINNAGILWSFAPAPRLSCS